VSPETGKPHQAVFAFQEPITSEFGARLKLSLMQNYRGNKYSLGRFRVSVTSSEAPLDFGLPPEIGSSLKVAANDRTEEQQQQLLDYRRKFDHTMIKLRDALTVAKRPLPEDPQLKQLEAAVAEAKQPIRVDPALARLRRDVQASTEQLENKRLTAAQDVAWALINNPAFLFNR
jgi:hypothetical protein